MTTTSDDLREEIAKIVREVCNFEENTVGAMRANTVAERVQAIPYLADAIKLKIDHDKLMLGPSVGAR